MKFLRLIPTARVAAVSLVLAARLSAQGVISYEQALQLPMNDYGPVSEYVLGLVDVAPTARSLWGVPSSGPLLVSVTQLFTTADQGGNWTLLTTFPARDMLLTEDTEVTASVRGQTLYFTGGRGALYAYDPARLEQGNTVEIDGVPLGIGLAGNDQAAFITAADKLYRVKLSDGVGTNLAINGNADGSGQTLKNVAFGSDGRLYVLDAMNRRVQRFDVTTNPTAATLLDAMAIDAGLPVNFDGGMAIGPTGRIYLADGSGGGVGFDFATGVATAFAAPAFNPANGFATGNGGKSLISADADGDIYVLNWDAVNDQNTFYRFHDSSVSAVPEPSTYAAIAGAAMLPFAAWHRRRLNRNAGS